MTPYFSELPDIHVKSLMKITKPLNHFSQ